MDGSTKIGVLAGVAIIAGLGKLLASQDKLTWRVVIGRVLTSAALGVAASLLLVLFPSMPLEAQLGAAAALSSLGTSALEAAFYRFLGSKPNA